MTPPEVAAPAKKRAKAKKKGPSPSLLTRRWMEANGYLPWCVEQVIPHTFIKRDMYGFIDFVGIRDGETLAVQSCSAGRAAGARGEDDGGRGSDAQTRADKIREHANLPAVLAAGWKVVVHAWRVNAAGEDELRVIPITSPIAPVTPFDP
jgi:hypothetical protein